MKMWIIKPFVSKPSYSTVTTLLIDMAIDRWGMNAILPGLHRYRSIWVSDIHLGTPGCKAALFLDFLKNTESQKLYLVGDIIDLWRMKRSWFWRQEHNDIIQKLLRKARKGTQVIYVPGNHDEDFRDFDGNSFGNVDVFDQVIHTMADGKRFLVLHGDQFDGVVKYAPWLAKLGDKAYGVTLIVNDWFNRGRRLFGFPYWSLSAYLKHQVKDAVEFISCFNNAVVDEANRQGLDGVICGHIHHPEIKKIGNIIYANDGDWVESCSALVEHMDGRLEIVYWTQPRQMELENTGQCVSSSSQTLGFLKSMASYVRLTS